MSCSHLCRCCRVVRSSELFGTSRHQLQGFTACKAAAGLTAISFSTPPENPGVACNIPLLGPLLALTSSDKRCSSSAGLVP